MKNKRNAPIEKTSREASKLKESVPAKKAGGNTEAVLTTQQLYKIFDQVEAEVDAELASKQAEFEILKQRLKEREQHIEKMREERRRKRAEAGSEDGQRSHKKRTRPSIIAYTARKQTSNPPLVVVSGDIPIDVMRDLHFAIQATPFENLQVILEPFGFTMIDNSDEMHNKFSARSNEEGVLVRLHQSLCSNRDEVRITSLPPSMPGR